VRRAEEVLLVVHRRSSGGPEYLVLHRVPERGGYWHLAGGGLEDDESVEVAARRELAEETRLEEPLGLDVLPLVLGYHDGRQRIAVHFCAVEAPAGWEPVLDEEHDDLRWLPVSEAAALVRYPEPRQGLEAVSRVLEGAA
jgi:8-oxo-dGTP pyrophosphatase MutT (NUDIX family)